MQNYQIEINVENATSVNSLQESSEKMLQHNASVVTSNIFEPEIQQ